LKQFYEAVMFKTRLLCCNFSKNIAKLNIMNIIEVKKFPNSQMEILAELTSEEFVKSYRKSVEELSRDINIPGFRPGRAPESIIREKIGENKILQTAADIAVKEAYFNILKSENIEAVGRPEITVTKIVNPLLVLKTGDSPLCFKIKIAILPEVKLPDDYKSIAKEVFSKKEEIVVEDKEIENALDYIRRSKIAKKNLENRKEADKNEENLPELDDDFARSLGSFQNLNELKETIKKNIFLEKEMKAGEKKRVEALESLSSKINAEIPDVLIESEQEKLFNTLKHDLEHMGLKWEDYLSRVKKSEAEINEELKKDALKRVWFALVLDAVAKKENIEVSDEEIEKKEDEIMASYSEEQKNKLDRERLKIYTYDVLRNEKVFIFLAS